MAQQTNGNHVNGSNKTSLEALPVFSIAKPADEKTKAIAECLRDNHATFVALRDPYLLFHNHMPHILGSAYYLGASGSQLKKIAESESKELRPHKGVSVQEAVSPSDWRKYLNSKDHTLAFQKLFDDEIDKAGGDWKKVVDEYMFSSDAPIVNGMCGGLGHPFIHLAYAYEFDSREVASEALSMTCTEYDMMHGYLDNPPPDTSTYKTRNYEEILARVRADDRFKGHFDLPGFLNTFTIHATCEAALLEHWNALSLEGGESDGIAARFEELFDVSVRLAIDTGDADEQFDFFLIHILTVVHGIRILLPTCFPRARWESIYRQFWLWTLLMYVSQLRRPIHDGAEASKNYDLQGRDWAWVENRALTDKWSLDAHYVKVIRALKVGPELFGDKDGWYLKAAVKFIDQFSGWVGFGKGIDDFPGLH